VLGFGSCHSLGVAVGLRGYGMCQMRWAIRRTTLLKNAKGRLYYFLVCPRFNFFKVHVVPKSFTCPLGKSLLVKCHPLDDQIVRGPIAGTTSVSPICVIYLHKPCQNSKLLISVQGAEKLSWK